MQISKGNQGNPLNELTEIARNNLLHSQSIERRLGLTEANITKILKDVGQHDTQLSEIAAKVENLELNYEITDEQRKMINTRARARVIEFIGYPSAYFRVFINNCYSFLRSNHHLGSTISTTKRRNYDYVMEGIAAWHPDIEALKARKDEADAESRKHEAKIEKMVDVALIEQDKERSA